MVKMAEFEELLVAIRNNLHLRGHWLESGEIQIGDELWTYKFQRLKRKSKKSNDVLENKS